LVRGWGWLGVGVRVGKWGLKVGKNWWWWCCFDHVFVDEV
jgi:hypothetical protein